MKTILPSPSCSRLRVELFLATLVVAVLTVSPAWAAAPTPAQQAYLKASNTGAGDQFGYSVAVSGDTVVVGAYQKDSSATGVNGEPSDNSGPRSGAAYVFTGLGVGPRLAFAPDGGGGCFIRFTGAPDVTYRLQRASGLTNPWDTIAALTAPAAGVIESHDATPIAGQAFYRTAQP